MATDQAAEESLLDTEKIRRLREGLGITQEEAATRAGFKGRQAWSNFESGQQTAITLGTLAKLAAALGVHARDLLKPGPAPVNGVPAPGRAAKGGGAKPRAGTKPAAGAGRRKA